MFHKNTRLWVYGVLLAISSALLFVDRPDYFSSRSFKHVQDIGHIVYFALLAVLLSRWHFVARKSLVAQWAIILVITLLVGISIELIQAHTGRSSDAADVLRDLTGSLMVLVFGSPGSTLQAARLRLPLRVAALALLLHQLWPLTRSLIDEAIARQQFPLLSDFETPFEIDRWAGSAGLSVESVPSIPRDRLLKLSLTTDKYSSAVLNHFDGDWTSFRTLNISLYNPDEDPLEITSRIYDRQHVDDHTGYEDRFNGNFLLRKGWNHIEIDLDEVEESPADRNMDMSRIRGLMLVVSSIPAPRTLYLNSVRLSP